MVLIVYYVRNKYSGTAAIPVILYLPLILLTSFYHFYFLSYYTDLVINVIRFIRENSQLVMLMRTWKRLHSFDTPCINVK